MYDISEMRAQYDKNCSEMPIFCIFAYGSLIWRPDFKYANHTKAIIHGYHRRFGLLSTHYRGTVEQPGLVLGLDDGGNCEGVLYRVADEDRSETMAYLWNREMIGYAYKPIFLTAIYQIDNVPHQQTCLTFALMGEHPQYAPKLSIERAYACIKSAFGAMGSNITYLLETARALQAHGITDTEICALYQLASNEFGAMDHRQLAHDNCVCGTNAWQYQGCTTPMNLVFRCSNCQNEFQKCVDG